jgi:hypothetical protein
VHVERGALLLLGPVAGYADDLSKLLFAGHDVVEGRSHDHSKSG